MWQSLDGWTDVDKQCSMGDMVWPSPAISWEGDEWPDDLPSVSSSVCLDDSWNAGSCLRLDMSSPGFDDEDAHFRCVWLPIQSLTMSPRCRYEARIVYKLEHSLHIDLDIGLSLKVLSGPSDHEAHLTGILDEHDLPGGWKRLAVQFSLVSRSDVARPFATRHLPDIVIAIGFIIAIAPEQPLDPFSASLSLGQLDVFPATPPDAQPHDPLLTWADFLTTSSPPSMNGRLSGTLHWDAAVTFAPSTHISDLSPDDPNPVWKMHIADDWFRSYLYFNVYMQTFVAGGHVADPELATWIGTTGLDGQFCEFALDVPLPPVVDGTQNTQVRFYIQGVDDHGDVLPWNRCVFVDVDLP